MEYSSIRYTDENDLKDSQEIVNSEKIYISYKIINSQIYVFWATNNLNLFIKELFNFVEYCKDINLPIYLEFVPEQLIDDLESLGFRIVSEWIDFFNEDLRSTNFELRDVNIRKMLESEIDIVSEVTKSCYNTSRGFCGEDKDLIKEWHNADDTIIFVVEERKTICGVCVIIIYDSNKGKVLWIRELAVDPKYQSKGYGQDLIKQAIQWGIDNKINRSFLAVDANNARAINIYKKYNYRCSVERGQINMLKR